MRNFIAWYNMGWFSSRAIKAFTLFELLITLSLVLLFSMMGIPLLQSAFNNIKSYTVMSGLHHALSFARMQAISTGKPVSVCPSADGINCVKDWSKGYIIYIDESLMHRPTQVLKVQQLNLHAATLKLQAFPSNHSFTFMPSGTSHHGNGTFIYCNHAANQSAARAIVVSKPGRIRAVPQAANC